jgi:hypothetical protein
MEISCLLTLGFQGENSLDKGFCEHVLFEENIALKKRR